MYALTYNELYYALGLVAILVIRAIHAIFEPHKTKFVDYNTVEVTMFLILALMLAVVLSIKVVSIKLPHYVTHNG